MATKTTFKVPDMVCGGCANSIRNALGKKEGIEQVEIDVDKKTVSVDHDEEILASEKIGAALEEIGFPVRS